MAAGFCPRLLRFAHLRVERLTSDGSPDAGAGNLYETNSQISLAIGYNNRAGDDFEVPNGDGDICFGFLEEEKLKNLTLGLVNCTHDPEYLEMMLGGEIIRDGGDVIGYALPRVGVAGAPNGVAITGWTRNILGTGVDPTFPYVKFLMPKTTWAPADKSLENNPITNALSGVGYENEQYLDGGLNDWIGPSASLWQFEGTTDIPDDLCAAQSLPSS